MPYQTPLDQNMLDQNMLPNLVLLGLLALGLAAGLTLFMTLKYEVRLRARKDRARMDTMLKRLQDAERPAREPSVSAPVLLRSGMNTSKRAQVVRLLRRGEDVSHVAAALGVTRREVELLMRVQTLSARRAVSAGG
jgi:hypothetical protein